MQQETEPNPVHRRKLPSHWPEWLTLAAYAALVGSTIPYHEPWVDEAQAWQLARSLPLTTLFKTYLRYEGHPGLWHLLLSGLVHLGVSYTGMHWVAGAIALAGVSLLIFRAPFPRLFRLTLPFTFFLAYQYAVVARGYVLAPLLMFALAIVWRRSPLLVALLLGLLGNIAVHLIGISGGLALAYVLERWRADRLQPRRPVWTAAALLLAFFGFAVWTIWPPHDLYFVRLWGGGGLANSIIPYLVAALYSLAFGLTQPVFLAFFFWGGVLWWLERHHRLVYLLPVAALACLSGYAFSFWHAGLIVPTLIAIFWIIAEDPALLSTPPLSRKRRIVLTAGLLCFIAIQIGWTAYAVAWDFTRPYSPDLATAKFLTPYVEAGEPIGLTYAGDEDRVAFVSVGLAPYFSKSIFFNHPRPYWWWSTHERQPNAFEDLLRQHPPMIVVESLGAHASDPPQISSDPKIQRLQGSGYTLTHIFCGAMPQRFGSREEICHVIYESKVK
ncbi:hypothetical protein [Edaphobacter bradus]|uniref:hypothetical protein n=1 Tax=Edaphobacter bradus TaxID=2259016 RepID=UPI0021E0A99A|nr:hypothetical protein [Edaphobacter bradus]